MDKHAVWSTFSAMPGREQELEAFLHECCASLANETGTTRFFALKLKDGRYGTFDTMQDDAALAAHIGGPTAAAVRAEADKLFTDLEITPATILAAKTVRG